VRIFPGRNRAPLSATQPGWRTRRRSAKPSARPPCVRWISFWRSNSLGISKQRQSARLPGKARPLPRGPEVEDVPANGMPSAQTKTPHELPCAQRFDPAPGLVKLAVTPRKGRDRHQLVATDPEQAFEEQQLEKLGDDQDRQSADDVTRCRQIGCERLGRFENENRHDKEGERRI